MKTNENTNEFEMIETEELKIEGESNEQAKPEFSDAPAVEKEEIEIGKTNGDTAEFVLKDETDDNAVDVSEIEENARDYYKATHSASVEEKISQLSKNAENGFEDFSDFSDEEPENKAKTKAEIKAEKKAEKEKKKKKRNGVVSNDDIDMLVGAFKEEDSDADDKNNTTVEADFGLTPEEPEEEKPESEEDRLINLLGKKEDKKKDYLKVYNDVFDTELPCDEYTDREQEESILKNLKNNAAFSLISVAVTFLVTVLCVYFEMAAGTNAPHPAIFEPGKYSAVFAMCMLQFMCVGAMFNLDGLKRAFMGLRPRKSTPESVVGIIFVVCTLQSLLTAIVAGSSPSARTLCSVGCLALLFLAANGFIKAFTALSAFCVAASQKPKYAVSKLEEKTGEHEAFEKYLDEETDLITSSKAGFVKGFFKKIYANPMSNKKAAKTIVAVCIAALVIGVLKGILSQNLYLGICAFSVVALAGLPLNMLLSTALPYFIASMQARKYQTAFIGEAACDTYSNVGVVSFEDTEVFPAKNVKVSSIRTYSNHRIDKVILYMAKVFNKIDGPLSYVFSNSVHNIEESDGDATVSELFSDGISARIADLDILIGNSNFMKAYNIEPTEDDIDEQYLHSFGCIMYMAVNGSLAAKFYVKYAINRNFESILRSFYNAGICVGIKTLDPNITNELICGNLKGTNYPISVIRKHGNGETVTEITETTESAIVSLSGLHNFLKGFLRLDGLRNVYRSNAVISGFAAIMGVLVAAIFALTSSSLFMSVLFSVIFQLVWCIPTVLFSVFSK